MTHSQSEQAFRLDGRVALITGGTRGIGAAIARDFAAAGARVLITGRQQIDAEAAAAEIVVAGGAAQGFAYDATTLDAVQHLAGRIRDAVGRLDILVNNAAILKPHVIERITEAEFDLLFHVNVKSMLFLSKLLHPLLQESANAAVVNITAVGAHAPVDGIGLYCASKAAVVNLTRTLAREWAPIRVNALTPGSTATDMILPRAQATRETFIAKLSTLNLLKRLAEPLEIARAARFLASDAASYITGQVLIVDGGMLA
jgi:NAD(P)-dependent dehydrogenase (short-subunit alcohol dehydrogenase family)